MSSGPNGLPDLIVRDKAPKVFDLYDALELMVVEKAPDATQDYEAAAIGGLFKFQLGSVWRAGKTSDRYAVRHCRLPPSRSLKYIPNPDLTKTLTDPFENSLAFESTVQNMAIHAWLLSLYSERAIARGRQQPTEAYERSLDRFEKALNLVYEGAISFEVEIEPAFQPRLRVSGKA